MLDRLRSALRAAIPPPPASVARARAGDACRAPLEEIYPPNDGTIPVVDADRLLEGHSELVADILQASSLSVAQARELLARPIEAFARHVLTLPATRDAFYAGKGGLLRLGLDCALFAARKAQVSEFSGFGNIERRRLEAPRWRLACILAALCCDLHRTVTQYAVVSPTGTPWTPLFEPLADFVRRDPSARVALMWRTQSATRGGRADLAWNLPLASRIIDASVLRYLYEGDPEVLAHLYSVLSGEAANQPSNVIRPLVEETRARLIARDQALDPMRFGKRGLGTSLGPYLADGLRQLKQRGRWTVNDERGRIWVAKGAVFLVWPIAAKEIRAWLEEARLPGIPRDDHTIAEFLSDARLLVPFGTGADAASLLWRIGLPSGREVSALRLQSPDILFPDGELPDAQGLQVLGALNGVLAAPERAPASAPPPPVGAVPAPAPEREPAAATPAAPEAAAGIEEASKILDYSTQLLVKELRKLVARPKLARGIASLRPDGSLSVRCSWIHGLGFDPAQLGAKLDTCGWLMKSGGRFICPDAEQKGEVIVFQPRIARLLVGKTGADDLLAHAAAAEAQTP